jgi:hypothetical protein
LLPSTSQLLSPLREEPNPARPPRRANEAMGTVWLPPAWPMGDQGMSLQLPHPEAHQQPPGRDCPDLLVPTPWRVPKCPLLPSGSASCQPWHQACHLKNGINSNSSCHYHSAVHVLLLQPTPAIMSETGQSFQSRALHSHLILTKCLGEPTGTSRNPFFYVQTHASRFYNWPL